jgi:uncharacterized Zn-finger protein
MNNLDQGVNESTADHSHDWIEMEQNCAGECYYCDQQQLAQNELQ